ncbi:MAG: ubiquinol-cytochrome c reductase iron-sulfur subunit [Phycisphaerales bacterium]
MSNSRALDREPPPRNGLSLPVLTSEDAARRLFLVRVSLGLTGVIALCAAVPVVGFIVGPFLRRVAPIWRAVGPLDSFKVGETVIVQFENTSSLPWSGVTSRSAAWLRRVSTDEFIAFSVNCRHLGCPVRWVPDAELFMCPCHGGVYYKDGSVAAGPPPAPLKRYPVRVTSGVVEIQADPLPLTSSGRNPRAAST